MNTDSITELGSPAPNSRVVAQPMSVGTSVSEWKRGLIALSEALGWSKLGGRPFSEVIRAGARVVVKPNWVLHANKGPWGLEPLLTDPSLTKAVCELALESGAATVTLGDAPLQGCDIEELWRQCGFSEWALDLQRRGARLVGPLDFRRTVSTVRGSVLVQKENQQTLDRYRLVNVGADSLLEPITNDRQTFRVTQYDPALMGVRHRRAHHEYLVAAEILDATVVINLPKLKTHKKAGITCALKNLVGINGNKEFLPHHRVGSPKEGGDCYRRSHPVRRLQESILDMQNGSRSDPFRRVLHFPLRALSRFVRDGDRTGLEGAWSGNDTVWRMTLDLNRVLQYADREGSLTDTRQRRELNIVDAVVCGQGDGPLAPEAFALGLLLGSEDPVAMDYIGARLLGYDPNRIASVREAFSRFRFPLTDAVPADLVLHDTNGNKLDISAYAKPARYPEGWVDAVDRAARSSAFTGTTFRAREVRLAARQ